ncbi:DNA-binding response regulator [Malaciobacter canalis]|uniref:DNA-binding response regulator n=1 Tax=Malaciobacter canalis TaxID=1912871 RepID=A0ABX4LS34_9BACT|nr:response regulator transcription factor [Malaciobacter canalis]PHO10578.1 DNA-binding response regulator [Malaciobacter canalis]QEE32028.1 two-component system response regulator [Malaciobacter canalis]
MINILMIEDDIEIAELLTKFFQQNDIKLTNFEKPELGISALRINKYDLVLLDLSLPEIDGVEVCKIIRKNSNIPIIISSARSDIKDKTLCYEYGADDYLSKPYDPQELVLKIQSIIRRENLNTKKEKNNIFFKNDENKKEIRKNGKLIDFTNAEYNIMAYLIKKSGFVVTRQELLINVESIKYESTYKSIDVLIGRIRKKIEQNSKKPRYIKSLRGIGYKLINE